MWEIDIVSIRSRHLHHRRAIQMHIFKGTLIRKFLKLLCGGHTPVATQEFVGCIVLKVKSRTSAKF